jgi:hypothetical protein
LPIAGADRLQIAGADRLPIARADRLLTGSAWPICRTSRRRLLTERLPFLGVKREGRRRPLNQP